MVVGIGLGGSSLGRFELAQLAIAPRCWRIRQVARSWLRNANTALGGIPIETIRTVPGLIDAIAYLDARRAPL